MSGRVTASNVTAGPSGGTNNDIFMWANPPSAVPHFVGTVSIQYGTINVSGSAPTIGDVRSWSIDEARERAKEWQRQIDNGQDLRQVIADTKAAGDAEKEAKIKAIDGFNEQVRRESVTVGEAWADYLTEARSKLSDRHKRDHENYAYKGGDDVKREAWILEQARIPFIASETIERLWVVK